MTPSLHRYYLVLLIVVVVFSTLLELASSLSAPLSTSTATDTSTSLMAPTTLSSSITPKIITISEKVWRKAASTHSQRIRHLLQPGLLPLEYTVTNSNSDSNKSQQKSRRHGAHCPSQPALGPPRCQSHMSIHCLLLSSGPFLQEAGADDRS